MARIQEQLDRYGLLVVFFGRYLTGVRPAVFLAAGAARIPVRKFIVVDGLSALVSLLVWVLVGWAASGWIELALRCGRPGGGADPGRAGRRSCWCVVLEKAAAALRLPEAGLDRGAGHELGARSRFWS